MIVDTEDLGVTKIQEDGVQPNTDGTVLGNFIIPLFRQTSSLPHLSKEQNGIGEGWGEGWV